MMFDQAKGSDIFAHFTTGSALALMAARLSKAVSGNESPMLTENALHAVCAICGLLCLLSHICHFPSTNKVLIIVMAVAAFIRPGYVHCIGHWSTIGVAQCRLQLTAALVIGSLVGYLCEWIVRTMWLERLRCARKRREQNVLDPVAEEPLCMHAATLLFSGASAEVASEAVREGTKAQPTPELSAPARSLPEWSATRCEVDIKATSTSLSLDKTSNAIGLIAKKICDSGSIAQARSARVPVVLSGENYFSAYARQQASPYLPPIAILPSLDGPDGASDRWAGLDGASEWATTEGEFSESDSDTGHLKRAPVMPRRFIPHLS
eukprot:CAMPEP_0119303196 /NCGR_PEP_ID=MMETSP1333-20130426/4656_1 /TAXON_ID=418940 /ORGANISM="Scyphosphaera apsteinii, Strain RCC1455" /LENGTH=321 /DNA_ID=CAMNT_0007305803 /DNA_START=351 /DNA_END=1318 /DNA_ORIENTATION=+